ncbi:phenylacetate--CoA ligase family protein [Nocardioides speluncae]|uniref:phenylacetate--CoA ligase family protein n=1 Tax=Nocardioides speluncae TaxID=2670337 RepID=UPI000D692435|nr:AMP-binding protein [Nocardioides speluncae]
MPAKPLRDLVAFARRNSPFYADLYRDVPDDWVGLTDLPVIDQPAFWAANRWPDNRLLTGPLTDAGVYTSGGTTGAPKVSPWTRTEHLDSTSAFGAGMVRAGLRAGHRVANLMFVGHLYGGFLYIEASLHNAPVENVRLPVAGHTPDEDVAELIESFGVEVLAGTPMKLGGVAEAVLSLGTRAESVELLLFAGDLLFDDLRPRLAKAFPNAAIASMGYATVDAGLVGAPVPGDDVRVHEAVADRTIVEILDEETDEPIRVHEVRGRVVVTNLFRTLLPIIRYPVGDLAEWVDAGCRAFRLVGRTEEGARVADVAMSYVDVHDALLAADTGGAMVGMQMVARRWDGKDGLILRLATVGDPSPTETQGLVEAVYAARGTYQEGIADGHVHPLAIEWVRPADLVVRPRTGKLVQVIDERPHA